MGIAESRVDEITNRDRLWATHFACADGGDWSNLMPHWISRYEMIDHLHTVAKLGLINLQIHGCQTSWKYSRQRASRLPSREKDILERTSEVDLTWGVFFDGFQYEQISDDPSPLLDDIHIFEMSKQERDGRIISEVSTEVISEEVYKSVKWKGELLGVWGCLDNQAEEIEHKIRKNNIKNTNAVFSDVCLPSKIKAWWESVDYRGNSPSLDIYRTLD